MRVQKKGNSTNPPNGFINVELSDFIALLNLGSAIAPSLVLTGTARQTNNQAKRGITALILLFPPSLNDTVSKSDLVLRHC